jgi:hypothetical protein
MTTTEIITYALAALGTIATLANIASAMVPKDSTAGKWLAWIASMPIKHAPGKLPKVDVPGAVLLLACSTLLLPLCTGCVGTLDDARGRISPAMGAPRSVDLSKRCQSLSDREFYLGFASTAFGATGLGAVVTSIPVDEPKWETVAVISGASAAAVSVVTGWGALKSATTYTEEGCGK